MRTCPPHPVLTAGAAGPKGSAPRRASAPLVTRHAADDERPATFLFATGAAVGLRLLLIFLRWALAQVAEEHVQIASVQPTQERKPGLACGDDAARPQAAEDGTNYTVAEAHTTKRVR